MRFIMRNLSKLPILVFFLLCIGWLGNALAEPRQVDSDTKAVLQVLQRYNDAIQALTTVGTFELFTDDAQVYEQGGVEGTYAHYVEHHLGPELAHFEQFTFSDYQADAEIIGNSALVTQTYRYTIVTKAAADKPSRTIDKQGLATSVLIKTDVGWKIKRTHSSARALKIKK
jgi:ketosteroid isomerase-like protein